MKFPVTASVLIAGAGPSGLMMAAQLLRYGIQPVIIDSKTAPSQHSKALAIQARSMEIFSQMGIAESFMSEGNTAKNFVLQEGEDEIARIDLSTIGAGKTPFPFVLILEQNKTERILLDYLTKNACPVFWNCSLTTIDQHAEETIVTVNCNGKNQTISCDWMIAADGAHSTVRKKLTIPFTGGTYEQKFFLADLVIQQRLNSNAIRLFLKEEGFTGLFPLQNNTVRFIGVLPKTLRERENLRFEDIKPYLTYSLDFPLEEDKCSWFATYQLHHRMAAQFKMQRCFLIGDAAHIHSPAGGQGMNTGLQDAYNLAWKIAGVINKEFDPAILNTYAEERIPVARKLLKTTDRLFSLAVAQSWFMKIARRFILPLLVKRIWKGERITERIFSLISQTGISYRDSKLSVHHSLATGYQAGDRLPYIKFYDEKLKEETDLHAWCNKTGFTLIVIGKLSERDILALAKWIKQSYVFTLNFYYLPYSKRNQSVFDSFEIRKNGKKAIIVRPDLHIGYMNDIVDIELIDGYFKEIL
ncbi:FAD-dependent oxidoreductase [Rubrolithibacter danxiaensis]|uniref:FAD-dependent oxidoreductase n=1 Tax=Rubrolithibacter danxiaensis TaxID=3390805 RepID=UPI003BF857E3